VPIVPKDTVVDNCIRCKVWRPRPEGGSVPEKELAVTEENPIRYDIFLWARKKNDYGDEEMFMVERDCIRVWRSFFYDLGEEGDTKNPPPSENFFRYHDGTTMNRKDTKCKEKRTCTCIIS
jgi:hypothetical protein